MFIFQDKQLNFSKLLRVLSLVIPILSLCIGAFFFFLHLGGGEEESVQTVVAPSPEPVKTFVGEGALALENTPLSFSLPHLERELNLLAMNTRPDRKADEDLFWIELRSSGERRKFREGEAIFLRFVREEGRPSWVFSGEATPISAQFSSCEKGGVKVGLTLELEGEGKFYAHEQKEFILKESAKAQQLLDNKVIKTETLPLDSLRQGVFWGVDLLIGKYGGATYGRVRHKCKFRLRRLRRLFLFSRSRGLSDVGGREMVCFAPLFSFTQGTNRVCPLYGRVSPSSRDVGCIGIYP